MTTHFMNNIKKKDFFDAYKQLNVGQRLVYHSVTAGKNILLTGGGGVGKSHLIRFLDRFVGEIVLTASTGIAGVNIEGQTLDSYMGFNQRISTPHEARRVKEEMKERFSKLKTLLIEEVSMTRVDRLEMVNQRLQAARGNDKPFGGVQVILCGDFGQLAPVVDERKESGLRFKAMYGERLFAFEADVYDEANFVPYVLTEYVRNTNKKQRTVLRCLRMGHRIQESIDYINYITKDNTDDSGIYMCKTNKRADKINADRYAKLPGIERRFYAFITGDFPKELYPAEVNLDLKIDAKVLITKNNADFGYCNGDTGIIKEFVNTNYETLVKVKLNRGPTVLVSTAMWENYVYEKGNKKVSVGTFQQVPLRLGYAITVHKSQGMTLDKATLDLTSSDFFNPFGLGYVGLSRLTSFEGLRLLRPLRPQDITFSKKAVEFTKNVSYEAMARMENEASRLHALEKLAGLHSELPDPV